MLLPKKQPILIFLIILFLFFTSSLYGQTAQNGEKVESKKNYYTIWEQLAMLGKSQAEIEVYLGQEVEKQKIQEIRDKVRESVLNELRNGHLSEMINKSRDADDFATIHDYVLTAIRYAGLELDTNLQEQIKEEFGLNL